MARGVEFPGSPITPINKIVAAGDDPEAINGFCDAESGSIPVASVAPSVLLVEVELQTSQEIGLRRPILPAPSAK